MKLLIVIDSINIGGGENIAIQEFNELRYRNYDVTLLSCKNEKKLNDLVDGKEIVIIERKYPIDFKFIFHFIKFLFKNKYTHIHFHSAMPAVYFLFSFIWIKKPKTFFTHHGFIDKRNIYGRFSLKYYLIDVIPAYFISRNIAVSNVLLEHLKDIAKIPRLCLLYNFYNKKLKVNIHDKKKLDKDNIKICMVGNFNNIRDHLTVVKAINFLIKKGYNIAMYFAGVDLIGGYLKPLHDEIIKEGTNKNFIFLGFVKDIENLIVNSDLFIGSSNYETFGISLLEAIILGIPCISSNIPAYNEIMENGKYCSLFKTGDYLSLSESIENNIFNYPIRVDNNKLVQNYSINEHIETLIKIYAK